jgi:hypothetical protein
MAKKFHPRVGTCTCANHFSRQPVSKLLLTQQEVQAFSETHYVGPVTFRRPTKAERERLERGETLEL